MNLNKKAQGTGVIAFVFLIFIFIVNWFIWLGAFIQQSGLGIINNTGLVGIEAFMFANLNVWILLTMTLSIMGFFSYSAQ